MNSQASMADSLFPEMHVLGHLREAPEPLIVELFAGLGGASQGLEDGLLRAVDIAVNHSEQAIAAHRTNHPQTRHYLSDVYEVDPLDATQGRPVDVLWASPDCTSFSVSKGGVPINRRLRMLPWVTLRWMGKTRPRYLVLENVREFSTTWGSLVAKRDSHGQVMRNARGDMLLTPSRHHKRRNARWRHFLAEIRRLGYHVEHRVLNAADYGAATTRKRLFVIASRDTRQIPWPQQTHAPADDPRVLAGELLPWVPISTCIDHTLPCPSVFGRAQPHKPNTRRRIALGLVRFVLADDQPVLVTCQHGGSGFRGQSIKLPIQTIVAANEARALVTARYGEVAALRTGALVKFQQNSVGQPLYRPIDTVMAGAQRFASLETTLTPGLPAQRPAGHAHAVYDLLMEHCPDEAEPYLDHGRRIVVAVHGGIPRVVTDVGLRMLTPAELALGQSFPPTYRIARGDGGPAFSVAAQVRLVGNAVPPKYAEAIGRSLRSCLHLPPSDLPPAWYRARLQRRAQAALALEPAA